MNSLIPPLLSKCVLVALIWIKVALLPTKTDAPLSSEEKGCSLWQSNEVCCRAFSLSALGF